MSIARQVFLNKLKSKPKVDPLQEILKLIREGRIRIALEIAISNIDKKTLGIYIYTQFIKSPFKSFHDAMKDYTFAIDTYLKTSDKQILIKYMSIMEENRKNMPVGLVRTEFNALRYDILQLLLEKRSFTSDDTISSLNDLNVYDRDENSFYKEHLANLMALKWPEHTGIKILFGSNK